MMGRRHYFDWSGGTAVRLTDLYREGLSFGNISRTLGCSRASAIAKARRLGITDRESPILRSGSPNGRSMTRPYGLKAKAPPSTPYRETRDFPGIDDDLQADDLQADELPVRDPADLSDLPGFGNFGISWEERWRFGGAAPGSGYWQPKTCQFIGSDGDHEHRKCGAAVVPGRAYCTPHLAICTIQPVDATTKERNSKSE